MTHGMNCPALTPGNDEDCTCGLKWRIEIEELKKKLEEKTPRVYPIQHGPSVPYEVMLPHESMCQKNHYQTIKRIAERGGFSPGEAWCVVNGIEAHGTTQAQWKEYEQKWHAFAERINLHYEELERLRAEKSSDSSPADLRALGWSVAVHNDYKLDGVPHTFWLFTNGTRSAKGEGKTDAEALNAVRAVIRAELTRMQETLELALCIVEDEGEVQPGMQDYCKSVAEAIVYLQNDDEELKRLREEAKKK